MFLDSNLTFTNSTIESNNLERLKEHLDEICTKIAEIFNLYDANGKTRRAYIVDTLLKYDCPSCISKIFKNNYANNQIDAIYSENHSLAVNLLVEMLRAQLNKNNNAKDIFKEVKGNFGRIDIEITTTRTGLILQTENQMIIVEVKTGKGFSYPQLFRYLLDKPMAILVLWRVTEGQIIALEGEKLRTLLAIHALIAIQRGQNILNSSNYTCTHQTKLDKNTNITNPQILVENFLEALSKNLPKVVEVIFSLLKTKMNAKLTQ